MNSHRVKVVLLGHQGVGKSSIERRYVTGRFEGYHKTKICRNEHLFDTALWAVVNCTAQLLLTLLWKTKFTIKADFTRKDIFVENQTIMLEIWDTLGQERFNSFAARYYRRALAAIVVYDVTNRDTYNRALDWIQKLRQNCDSDRAENLVRAETVVALVGNKVDLAETSRAVLTEDVSSYANENGMLFAETSAKTGMGVDDLFLKVAHEVVSRFDLEAMSDVWRDGAKLTGNEEKKDSGGCC